MPDQPDRPLFLAQRGYRQRRVIDAAWLLPVFGAFLLLVPVLWDVGGGGRAAQGDVPAPRLAERAVYIFSVWGFLVIAAAILGRRLRQVEPPPRPPVRESGDAVGDGLVTGARGLGDPAGPDAPRAPGGD